MWPKLRHVSTCLPCGYRKATLLVNSYPDRCPHCGGQLEHEVIAFDDALELRDVDREPRQLVLAWRP